MKITMDLSLKAILDLSETEFNELVEELRNPENFDKQLIFYSTPPTFQNVKVGISEPPQIPNYVPWKIHDLFSYFKSQQPQPTNAQSQRISSLLATRTFHMQTLLLVFLESGDYNDYINIDKLLIIENFINKSFPKNKPPAPNLFEDISIFDSRIEMQIITDLIAQSTAPKIRSFFYIPDLPPSNQFMLPDTQIPYTLYRKREIPDISMQEDMINYVCDGIYNTKFFNKSNDERALYIYYKMCQALLWDTKYTYNYKYGHALEYMNESYSSEEAVIKDLQSISPNSPRYCRSTCLIIAIMINSLVKDFEANVLLFDESPHISLWLRSDSMSAVFDPTFSPERSVFTDVTNAKLGFPIFCDEILY